MSPVESPDFFAGQGGWFGSSARIHEERVPVAAAVGIEQEGLADDERTRALLRID
jgi:hypothetical protein